MVNEVITSSLRNALDRGESIDSAIRSIISAGYDRFEVNEAAKVIIKEMADSQIPEGQRLQAQPSQTLLPPTSQSSMSIIQPQPTTQVPIKKKGNKVILIFIIIFLLVTLGILSYFLIKNYF